MLRFGLFGKMKIGDESGRACLPWCCLMWKRARLVLNSFTVVAMIQWEPPTQILFVHASDPEHLALDCVLTTSSLFGTLITIYNISDLQ